MTSKTRLVYLLITTFCLAGCGYKSRNPVSENGLPSADTIQTALAPRYAKGFKITVRPDGVKLLSISEPNNNHAIPELFALVPKGTKAEIPDGYTVIPTPTDRVICMTTPQLAGFTGLNAYDKVVATSTTRRMQNKEWLARLKDGRIIRKTKCFDFWERNVLFPKTKRSFFRTPKHPLPCPFPLNFSLLIITKKFGNLAKNRYICIV